MLKLTTTLVGFLIAAYARALQWRLLHGFEHVLGAVRQWLCFNILPTCDVRSRLIVDLGDIFGQTVEEFRVTVHLMGQELKATLTTAAEQARKTCGRGILSRIVKILELAFTREVIPLASPTLRLVFRPAFMDTHRE